MRFSRSLLAAYVCCALTVVAHGRVGAYSRGTWQSSQSGESQRKVDAEFAAEEPESSNAKDREVRRAKNMRYNTGGSDLTVERPPDSEIFVEQIWPAVEFIPAAQSAVVVVGEVVKVQPYLSSDRSRIYTEITISVDDFLKRDRVAANKTVVIDRPGGALKLKTGRVVRDDIQIDNLGTLQFGRRYVVFAQAVNDGNDLTLIKSYELADGNVFTNDSRPRRLISAPPGVPSTRDNEAAFLRAVREEIVSRRVAQSAFPDTTTDGNWSCLKRKDLLRDKQGRPVWLTSEKLMDRVIERHPIERPGLLGRNNLHGVVSIRILIDRDGKVICAQGVDGHPMAFASAIQSLRRWTFKAFTIGGKRKSVAGILNVPYDFR